MKDKRTYTKLKEHGEDMSHENESRVTVDPKNNDDRGPGDLTFLIEEHKREIYKWRQKESEWIKTENRLQNAKQIIDDLSAKIVKQVMVIAELEQKLKDKE